MADVGEAARELERQIFGGGDSDLSELSSDEEAAPRYSEEEPQSDEDEEPRTEGRNDGDYRDAGLPSQPRKSKGKRAAATDENDGEPRKKRRRAQQKVIIRTPSPELALTPEERRKKDLNDRLDAIIKKPKPKKKKKGGDEEDLGQAADEEEILKLRQEMYAAAKEDVEANGLGKPAIHKLRALPLVTATLQKSHLELIALDQGILAAIREWLEPLPDKSLPALNIQRELFALLVTMNIDTASLKESHIGKIVMFYSRCPRVEAAISRTANQLITNWMRPILRRSATWRDKVVARADRSQDIDEEYERAGSQAARAIIRGSLAPGMQDSGSGRRHAHIPQAFTATYTIAPRNRTDAANVPGSNSKESMEKFKVSSSLLLLPQIRIDWSCTEFLEAAQG